MGLSKLTEVGTIQCSDSKVMGTIHGYVDIIKLGGDKVLEMVYSYDYFEGPSSDSLGGAGPGEGK